MYYSHQFAREETLARALSWLDRLGFGPDRVHLERPADGAPRLSATVDLAHLGVIRMLIAAVERTESGAEGLGLSPAEVARIEAGFLRPHREEAVPPPPRASAIGWRRDAGEAAPDPELMRVRDVLDRRWGWSALTEG